MRRLTKRPIPAVLSENASAWLTEYLADRESQYKRNRYRHPDVKAVIREETAWKCVYCESKLGHNTPGDIEHKVPSSREVQLHFTWENMTSACTECNRRKNDYYDPAAPFLDPYSDDVEALLVHLGPIVCWLPGSQRAETTVRVLDLAGQRQPLLERKIETLAKARALLDLELAADTALLRALRSDELDRMCEVSAEYSAMVLTYVSKTRSPPDADGE